MWEVIGQQKVWFLSLYGCAANGTHFSIILTFSYGRHMGAGGADVGGSDSKLNVMGEEGATRTMILWSSKRMRIWVLEGRMWEVIGKHRVSFLSLYGCAANGTQFLFFLNFSYGRHMGAGGAECGRESNFIE